MALSGFAAGALAQDPATALDSQGQITIDGQPHSYLIRHLPVNAFPQLPAVIQSALSRRGCLIPQTFEAHAPENVIHGSLEGPGSSDWAVLCSAKGSVSLLVFFGDGDADPSVLATAAETDRLQYRPVKNAFGFAWGLDVATPQTVHEAQRGMNHPPPRPEHDAIADTIIDRKTIYRFYLHNRWTILDTQD